MYSYFSSSCFKAFLVLSLFFIFSTDLFAYDFNPSDPRCSDAPYSVPSTSPLTNFGLRQCPSSEYNLIEGPVCHDWCIKPKPLQENECLPGYTRYNLLSGGFVCSNMRCSDNSKLILDDNGAPDRCECASGYTNFNGQCKPICDSEYYDVINKSCVLKCQENEFRFTEPSGWYINGQDQNSYFQQNKCYDLSLKPKPPEKIECAEDEIIIDGKCVKKLETPDACDPESKFYSLCQWYHDWKIWRNDYDNYENDKHEKSQSIKLSLDQVREQDTQFYNEIRQYLENQDGSPSSQYPIIQFPSFCEWSNNICNWYLDWKDWRNNYNYVEELAYKDRQKIIENQEKDLKQNADFYYDARDFMEKQDNEQNQNPLEPDKTPYEIKEPENVDLGTNQYIQSSSSCPNDRSISLSMGGYSTQIVISYQSLCSVAIMFKPFVILMSFISGFFIISNTGRRAETGD